MRMVRQLHGMKLKNKLKDLHTYRLHCVNCENVAGALMKQVRLVHHREVQWVTMVKFGSRVPSHTRC